MENYVSFSATCIGASHVRKNLVCEDASGHRDYEKYALAVVADGHSEKCCFRAHIGADLATKAFGATLVSFVEYVSSQGLEEGLLNPDTNQGMLLELKKRCIANWNERVLKNLNETPISDEEYEIAGEKSDEYRAGQDLLHIFGCTVIAAILTERYFLGVQVGDGRCIAIDKYGRTTQPIPWDDRCFENITTSICQNKFDDPDQLCRAAVIDLKKFPLAAVVVATDGVEDHFNNMRLTELHALELVVRAAKTGVDKFTAELLSELPDFSASGNGDDVSVAGIISPDLIQNWGDIAKRETELRMDIISMQSSISRNNAMIESKELAFKSASDMLEALRKKELSYDEQLKECEAKARMYDEELYSEQIKEAEYKVELAEESLRVAKEKLEQLRQRNPMPSRTIFEIIKEWLSFGKSSANQCADEINNEIQSIQEQKKENDEAIKARSMYYQKFKSELEELCEQNAALRVKIEKLETDLKALNQEREALAKTDESRIQGDDESRKEACENAEETHEEEYEEPRTESSTEKTDMVLEGTAEEKAKVPASSENDSEEKILEFYDYESDGFAGSQIVSEDNSGDSNL